VHHPPMGGGGEGLHQYEGDDGDSDTGPHAHGLHGTRPTRELFVRTGVQLALGWTLGTRV
jgi:hypothetical protein